MAAKKDADTAYNEMVGFEYIPIESYPNDSQLPWHVKCARCGVNRYIVLGNARRSFKSKQQRRCCKGDKTQLINEQRYQECCIDGCQEIQRSLIDPHCRPHSIRLEKYNDVYADVPTIKSLKQNLTCLIPIDKKGTPCGEIAKKGFLGLHHPPTFDPKAIEWGAVCSNHAARWRRHGTFQEGKKMRPTLYHLDWIETINFYLDPENQYVVPNDNGCLLWQSVKTGAGYGSICIRKDGEGLTRVATHRKVWEVLKKEEIPVGNQIHHICGNRACVNIEHLENISYTENNAEACRVKALREKVDELEEELRRWKEEHGEAA